MLFSTRARQRSSLAVIPSTQRCLRVFIPWISISTDSKTLCTMMGSKTLSSSCPASDAMVTVRSLPMTLKAIWLTTSGMTGLTLPGMIDEPGCIGGRLISLIPARGPDESRRRSLEIFDSLIASRFTADEYITNAPVSWVASTRFAARTTSRPVIRARWAVTLSA